MKIPILHGPRDLRIEDQELDTGNLKPHEVWVETQISAFKIGTDRGNYEGAEDVPGAPTYPRPVGDSNLGIVRGVGSAVTRLKEGDRVAGQTWHCSEYVADERELAMVKVPEGVDSEDADAEAKDNGITCGENRAEDNRTKIEQLESEVKEKQEELEYSTNQATIDNLEEDIYNTKQSIKELKSRDGS